MSALQFVEVPGYAAILFRRSLTDLKLPGALESRSLDWLAGQAHWDSRDHTWTFESGATLTFGYLEAPQDHYRYQSAEFQFVGFDELTQFNENQYRYLHSRCRRPSGRAHPALSQVPLRVRNATNPGGRGHEWVKRRFIDSPYDAETGEYRVFIPATLDDNPHLDVAEYEAMLRALDPITYEQLRHGKWVKGRTRYFQTHKIHILEGRPLDVVKVARFWDLAATEEAADASNDPDYTVGALVGTRANGRTVILDIVRGRWNPDEVEEVVLHTAQRDGRAIDVWMEQEPGASGKSLVSHYSRNVLRGYTFTGMPASGDKELRARPLAGQVRLGNVDLVDSEHTEALLDQFGSFPSATHDDIVDACSGAFAVINGFTPGRKRKVRVLA